MVHEHQFSTQQADALGAHRHGFRRLARCADVGGDLHRMSVSGDGRLQASLICQALALLAGSALATGLFQLRVGRRDQQLAALAIEQQQGVGCQPEHTRPGADNGGNTQRAGDDRAVGGGAAASGEDASDALGI